MKDIEDNNKKLKINNELKCFKDGIQLLIQLRSIFKKIDKFSLLSLRINQFSIIY